MKGLGFAAPLTAHGSDENIGRAPQIVEALHVGVDIQRGELDRIIEVAAVPERPGHVQPDDHGRARSRRVLGRRAPENETGQSRGKEWFSHEATWGTGPRVAGFRSMLSGV